MADDQKTDAVADKPVEESKYDYKKHSKASIESIAKEEKDERRKLREQARKLQEELANEKPEEPSTRPDKEPEKPIQEAQTGKTDAEVKTPEREAVDPVKIAQDAADKAAEKARADFAADLKKIEESKATEAAKEEKREELRAKWTGKDPATGQVSPRDWDEVVAENRRLALEDFRRELDEREARQIKATEEKSRQEQERQEQIDKINEANLAYVNRRVTEERDRMYDNRVLERPRDPNDPNDPAVVRERALFSRALAENEKRAAEGKEPITSLADIYYNYFLPEEKTTKQPAGADAPIAGNAATQNKPPEDRYSYVQDHRKSMREIAIDLKRALKR